MKTLFLVTVVTLLCLTLHARQAVNPPADFEGVWTGTADMKEAFAVSTGHAYNADYTLNIAWSDKDGFFCFTAYKKAKISSHEIFGIAYLKGDTLVLKEFTESPFDKKGNKVTGRNASDFQFQNLTAKLLLTKTAGTSNLAGEAKTFVHLKGFVNVNYSGSLENKTEVIAKIHSVIDSMRIVSHQYITSRLYNNRQTITENSTVRFDGNIANGSLCNMSIGDVTPRIEILNDINHSFSVDDFQDNFRFDHGQFMTTSKIFAVKQNLPPDSAFFKVSLDIGDVTITSKTVGVPVFNYFVTSTIRYPDSAVRRFKTLKSYFAMNGANGNELKNQFEAAIQDTADKAAQNNAVLTQMWRSVFIYRGMGGYEKNEEEGKKLANFYMLPIYGINAARAGDLESMYLAYCAYTMNLISGGDKVRAFALLDTAVKYRFPPALYEKGLQLLKDKKYEMAAANFIEADRLGIKAANFQLALLYEQGVEGKSVKDAFIIYESLAAKNDINSLVRMADLYMQGQGILKNVSKGVEYLNKAISLNSSEAMLSLANLYADKIVQEPKPGDGLLLLKKAAAVKNRDAMFQLAIRGLYENESESRISRGEAISMLTEAAKLCQPQAMHLLGMLYGSGVAGIAKDDFLSRFWLSQAKQRGVGKGVADSIVYTNPLGTFIDGALSYKPHIYYKVVTDYGHVLREGYADDDLLTRFVNGGLSVLEQSSAQKQETINTVKLIYADRHHKVYGGILTSRVELPEKLSGGQMVNISASGTISVGDVAATLHGNTGPEGMTNGGIFDLMSITANLPHGCVMAGVPGSDWTYVGKEYNGYLIRGSNNDFICAVNDKQYSNNQGYFYIRIDVYDFMSATNKY